MSLNAKYVFAFVTCLIGALATMAFASSSQAGSVLSAMSWQSPHFQQHQLVGKIWSTQTQKFVEWPWLAKEIKTADFLLLGENHDNSDHHHWQAKLLHAISTPDKPAPLLVVEMIPPKLSHIFDQFKKSYPQNLEKLGAELAWKKRGWGNWAPYSDIFKVARDFGAKVVAGNLDKADTRRVGRKGLTSVTEKEKVQWALDIPYSAAQKARLSDLLFASHCKFVPKKALSPMALVQQARDGAMADAMLKKPEGSTAVLIAGSGHARKDIAVPRILRLRASGAKILSVAFTEVTPNHKMPQEYEPQSADKSPVFDYLFFTPKFDIKDHCAALAKRFGKHKAKKKP